LEQFQRSYDNSQDVQKLGNAADKTVALPYFSSFGRRIKPKEILLVE